MVISIYDIQRAVADKATVPIYYESRISKLSLNAAELPKLDAEFEVITEGQVNDVFTAAGLERQRRGTCQPRATPWDCVIVPSSPEGAAQPLSRPFRAGNVFDHRTQGVALGWYISPLWGCGRRAGIWRLRLQRPKQQPIHEVSHETPIGNGQWFRLGSSSR